jgi:hypothetical protein
MLINVTRNVESIVNLNVPIEYILYIIIDISTNEYTLSYILLIYCNNGSVE